MVEDSAEDAELTHRQLLKSELDFEFLVCPSKESFIKNLEREIPDLIISDYNLPAFNGAEALSLSKQKCHEVPFILVSGELGDEGAVNMMKKGATDFVLKNNLIRLPHVIKRALAEAEAERKDKMANEKIRLFNHKLELEIENRTAEINQQKEQIKQQNVELNEKYIKIHELNARLEAQSNSLNQNAAVFILDVNGEIVNANNKFCEESLFNNDELNGKLFLDLLNRDYHDSEYVDDMWKKISSGLTFRNELLLNTKKDSAFWTDTSISPILDCNNTPINYLGISFEITARKEIEEELKSKNQDIYQKNIELSKAKQEVIKANYNLKNINGSLESKVLERTDKLKKSNEELDLFIYKSSHDLRRPITTLMGLLNILKDGQGDNIKDQIFDKMNHTILNMDLMLRKLIMVNDINSEGNCNDHININYLFEQLKESDPKLNLFDFKLNVNEDLGSFICDENLLMIILKNIILNAIQFRNRLNPQLTITLDGNDKQVILIIEDNGQGISSEVLPFIFNMFYVGSLSSKGNGLGLFLAKKSVERLGGSIQVDSELNQYTKFAITLPRLKNNITRLTNVA